MLISNLFAVDWQIFNNKDWRKFDNNAYLGIGWSANNAMTSSVVNSTKSSLMTDIGATFLLSNKVYTRLEFDANFLNQEPYVSNWYMGNLKVGYSVEKSILNFVPYLNLGYGTQGAYYSTTSNFNYGVGMLFEFGVTPDMLLYVDPSMGWQLFGSSISNDFDKNVGINNYQLNGTPFSYGIEIGARFIKKDFYLNPFFKYQNYNQSFSGGRYGAQTSNSNQYQINVNFGWLI